VYRAKNRYYLHFPHNRLCLLDEETGKRIRKSVTGKTKPEAVSKMRAFLSGKMEAPKPKKTAPKAMTEGTQCETESEKFGKSEGFSERIGYANPKIVVSQP